MRRGYFGTPVVPYCVFWPFVFYLGSNGRLGLGPTTRLVD